MVPNYVGANTPWGQSGKTGDAKTWEEARRPIVDALDRDGTFLDVGCANGYLLETVSAWAAEKGVEIEPYGVDIAPELVEIARARLPEWTDRLWVGNALEWDPPRRFDYVHLGDLGGVPPRRRRELVDHLVRDVCAPAGRFILGTFNEAIAEQSTEADVARWGYRIAGRVEVPHRDPRVVRRALWIDA